jgi:hypothetical protein
MAMLNNQMLIDVISDVYQLLEVNSPWFSIQGTSAATPGDVPSDLPMVWQPRWYDLGCAVGFFAVWRY